MKREKKGLSTVVTTLIIVLLVLAAIGIIWSPIRQLLTQSTSSLDQTRCLDLDIRATKVIGDSSDVTNRSYIVTLKRFTPGDFKAGAKLIFYNSTTNSDTLPFPGETFTTLQVRTESVDTTYGGAMLGVANANRVEVVPYLIDANTGQELICTTSSTLDFQV